MSTPQTPKPAKLIIGLIMKDRTLIDSLAVELGAAYGPIDMVSAWMPFDYTRYYEPEMGAQLVRRMLAFKSLIRQSELPAIKLATNRLEEAYSQNAWVKTPAMYPFETVWPECKRAAVKVSW